MAHSSRRSASPESAPGRKAVLFCPSCAHESPVDGDWRRQAGRDGTVYRCPSCGTDVTVRSRDRPSSVSAAPATAGGALAARSVGLAVGSVRLAVAWATWPCVPEAGQCPQS